MEKTGVQKLAGVLKVLVTITIGCNLLALFLVPGLAMMKGFGPLLGLTPYETALELPARVVVLLGESLPPSPSIQPMPMAWAMPSWAQEATWLASL